MILLALESSAKCCSAAITDNNTLLGEIFINTRLTHSNTLMSCTQSLLLTVGIPIESVDAFAIAHGPGSYTGLRIGIAAIKGMAYGLGKPCIGIPTLEAMAYGLDFHNGDVCCVMDARNQRVYSAFFNINCGVVSRLTQDSALPIDDVLETINTRGKSVYIIGDGAMLPKFQSYYEQSSLASPAPDFIRLQRASYVAKAARLRFMAGEVQSATELRAYYLKENYFR